MADPTRTGETGSTVTVVIGQHVVPGREEDYREWQQRMDSAASDYPGFIDVAVTEPDEAGGDWSVVYQFDSVAHLHAWLNSATRQQLIDAGAELFDGPATQQIVAGQSEQEDDTLVSVVVTHGVSPEREEEFIAWQDRVTDAERRFPGFAGAELLRPIQGIQDEWTAIFRFDSVEHAEAWLKSDQRRALLDEAQHFQDFKLQKIEHTYGSWFAGNDEGGAPPLSNAKTSLVVWVGLYPTVMLLTLGLNELIPGAKLWQLLLIGNLLSSFIMTYLTMPQYVNRLLHFFVAPLRNAPQPRTNLLGVLASAAMLGIWAVIFALTT